MCNTKNEIDILVACFCIKYDIINYQLIQVAVESLENELLHNVFFPAIYRECNGKDSASPILALVSVS